MSDIIFKFFPAITSLGPWLSKKGILFAGLLGIAFAFLLMGAGLIPTAPADPETTTFPLWRVLYLVIFPLVFVVLWLIITQIYLRSGQGTKIGLAYDGHAVNIEDWKRTKRKLCRLLKRGQIKNKVTLRFVPLSYCSESKRADKFKKRYGFSVLITIQQSPLLINDSDNAQYPIPMKVIPNIITTKEARQFLQTTFKEIIEINKTRNHSTTLADVLEAQAQDLHDMMLLFVASHCYLKKEYKDSAMILKFLDDSLSSIIKPEQSPRRQIRILAMNSCLKPTQFSVRDIPQPDKLREICEFAETALPYFDDSFHVPSALGKIRFLTGDIEGAIELTERFKKKIEEIKEAGQNPTSEALVSYYLNAGFLSFIQGHWVNAYDAYQSMLSIDKCRNASWNDIIEFVDYVETLECYEGICYLRTLYRLIASQSVPDELRAASREWCDQDRSREELGTLLLRRYPRRSSKLQQPNTKVKKQSKSVKQRSKRKRKPRNNKRKKR